MDLGVLDLMIRLTAAAACGAAVGFERETNARGAGARTHALVALGSAAFTLAGAYGFSDIPTSDNVDPARIAAQVAAGVGFIGAGAIIRHGTSVMGVTTAATVWLAAALGVAAAAGATPVAVASTIMALGILVVLRMASPLAQRIGCRKAVVEVEYQRGYGTLGPLLRSVEERGGRVRAIHVVDDDDAASADGIRQVVLHLAIARHIDIEQVLNEVGMRPEIRRVHVGLGEVG